MVPVALFVNVNDATEDSKTLETSDCLMDDKMSSWAETPDVRVRFQRAGKEENYGVGPSSEE